jgi:hypothetical protein
MFLEQLQQRRLVEDVVLVEVVRMVRWEVVVVVVATSVAEVVEVVSTVRVGVAEVAMSTTPWCLTLNCLVDWK